MATLCECPPAKAGGGPEKDARIDELSWELSVSADGQHWTWQVDRIGV